MRCALQTGGQGQLSDIDRIALEKAALDYHEFPTPGKLSITATKQLLNQSDLALAYSPGVAAASTLST